MKNLQNAERSMEFTKEIHEKFSEYFCNTRDTDIFSKYPKIGEYISKFPDKSFIFSIIVGIILGDDSFKKDYEEIHKLAVESIDNEHKHDILHTNTEVKFEYDFVIKSFFSLMNRFLTRQGTWGSRSIITEEEVFNGLVGLKLEVEEALDLVKTDKESNIVTNYKTFDFIRSSILNGCADCGREDTTADLLLVIGFSTIFVLVKRLITIFGADILIFDINHIKEIVEKNLKSLFSEITKTEIFNNLFGKLLQFHKTVNYAIMKGLEEHLEAFGNIDLSDVVDENGNVLIHSKDPRLPMMSNAIRFDNSFMEQLATYKKEENFISRKWITSNEPLDAYVDQLNGRLYFFNNNEFTAYVEKYKETVCGANLDDENSYRSNMVLLASDYVSTKATYTIYKAITNKMKESLLVKKNSTELDFFYVYFVKTLIFSDCSKCVDRFMGMINRVEYDLDYRMIEKYESYRDFVNEFGMGGSPSYSVFQEEFSKALKRFKEVL